MEGEEIIMKNTALIKLIKSNINSPFSFICNNRRFVNICFGFNK